MNEEGRKVVKFFSVRGISFGGNAKMVTVGQEEAPAKYVPAAAVTRKVRALFGIIGRKGHAGGSPSLVRNTGAQLRSYIENWRARVAEGYPEFRVKG